jgi:abortive infection bacteriophage resistance protein
MSKPAETYQQQLDRLKSRGLTVKDEPLALHILAHHNYYRLSAYRFPFTVAGDPDQFLPGITFEQVWHLYQFDRTLRHLVLEGCNRVEISVRSSWAYEIGHRLGPLSYLDNRHFNDPLTHARTLTKLYSEMERSQEAFIKHHKATLHMPWPPAWAIAEVASFGNISHMIAQLQPPMLRQAIADTYQLDESTFCSIVHHLCILRNTAAHHNRLWNRRSVFKVALPRKKPGHLFPNFFDAPGDKPGQERKIYNSLILLIHFVQVIEPLSPWPWRLLAHLQTLDPALMPDMGFPADWRSRPIWLHLLTTPQP